MWESPQKKLSKCRKFFYETDFFISRCARLGDFHIGRVSAVERYGYCFAKYGSGGTCRRFANTILVQNGNRSMEYYRVPVFDCFAETAEI